MYTQNETSGTTNRKPYGERNFWSERELAKVIAKELQSKGGGQRLYLGTVTAKTINLVLEFIIR